MELKDVILSTLAEMEDTNEQPQPSKPEAKEILNQLPEIEIEKEKESKNKVSKDDTSDNQTESELIYLSSIRERLLVLFEGFQAPNNKNIEAKIDMTLNFLEYVLATIDNRVEKLEKGNIK